MSIEKRVEATLKLNEDKKIINDRSVQRCIQFVRDMERAGVLKREQQFVISPIEGGLAQLKLYSSLYRTE